MDKDDFKEFSETLTVVATSFRTELSSDLIKAYWLGLRPMDLNSFKRAATRAMREQKFFPAVSELFSYAKPPEASLEAQAEEAWRSLDEARTKYGQMANVEFEDAWIAETVNNLGKWKRVCETTDSDWDVWFRKDFLRVYKLKRESNSKPRNQPLVGPGGVNRKTILIESTYKQHLPAITDGGDFSETAKNLAQQKRIG